MQRYYKECRVRKKQSLICVILKLKIPSSTYLKPFSSNFSAFFDKSL